MSGLRGSRFALRDFGGAGQIDENRVGLRSFVFAFRKITRVSSKPKPKRLSWKPFFFTKSAKMLGLRSFGIAPPGFQSYLRGFRTKTSEPSTTPQALLSPTSRSCVAVGLRSLRVSLQRLNTRFWGVETRLRRSSAISVNGAWRRETRLRRKRAISVSWSGLRSFRTGLHGVRAGLRGFRTGLRGFGAGRCVLDARNQFLLAFQKSCEK